MLRVRMTLARFFGKKPTKACLVKLAESREGRDAIARILRKAKADRVGNAMADLTVCGAVPPYNEILGGKIVALLMTSPEVVAEYRRRYGKVPSIIASSMGPSPGGHVRASDLAQRQAELTGPHTDRMQSPQPFVAIVTAPRRLAIDRENGFVHVRRRGRVPLGRMGLQGTWHFHLMEA
jgi:hypothetical protein